MDSLFLLDFNWINLNFRKEMRKKVDPGALAPVDDDDDDDSDDDNDDNEDSDNDSDSDEESDLDEDEDLPQQPVKEKNVNNFSLKF